MEGIHRGCWQGFPGHFCRGQAGKRSPHLNTHTISLSRGCQSVFVSPFEPSLVLWSEQDGVCSTQAQSTGQGPHGGCQLHGEQPCSAGAGRSKGNDPRKRQSCITIGRFDKEPGEGMELGLDTSHQSVTEPSKGLWVSAEPGQQPATSTLITGVCSSSPPKHAMETNDV